MRNINKVAIITAALALSLPTVSARADIIQALDGDNIRILSFSPLAQSFTAVDGLIDSFGFGITAPDTSLAIADLTMTLYDGAGFGGTVLGSQTIAGANVVTASDGAWNDFVFNSPVSLTVGNVYTAQISTTTTRRWGLAISDGNPYNPYAGGLLYRKGNETELEDAKFRVLATDTEPIPAPGAALLAMIGFGMVNRVKRRFA